MSTAHHAAFWALLDQALSSLSNFSLTLVAARSLQAREFGGFALVFAAYLTALGIARAVASEPLTVRYSGVPDDQWRTAASQSTGAALCTGAVGAILMVMVGALWTGPTGHTFLALAPFLPGLLLQDAWRHAFFAHARGKRAAANDAVWALLLALGLIPLLSFEQYAAWHFVILWGATGSIAGLVALWQARIIPRPTRAWLWFQEHRALIPRFASEFVSLFASGQLALYAIAAVAGLATVGAIRAAQVLLGPLNVLFMGANLFAVPEAARRARRDTGSLLSIGASLSTALVAAVIVWTAAVSFVSPRLGSVLLGRGWAYGRDLLLPVSVAMVGAAAAAGAATLLRGLADARRSLSARLVHAALVVGLATLGALVGGPNGGAWGLGIAPVCAAVNWWRAALASLREARPGLCQEAPTSTHVGGSRSRG